MRHQQPKVVIDYYAQIEFLAAERRAIRQPECCHTCENYNESGICQEFLKEPPADFAAQLNQCEKWFPIIPF